MFDHFAMWTGVEEPKTMVSRLKAAHVDIILPYVSKKPESYEASNLLIEEAHKHGIKVHGWFGDEMKVDESMSASVSGLRQVAADGSPIGLLCPANPEAVDYILKGLKRALTECDYDGISLEDGYVFDFKTTFTIRPNTTFDPSDDRAREYKTIPGCYCAYCKKHAPIEKPEWASWKKERLNDLIGAHAKLIRRIKPGAPFSAAARMPLDRSFYEPFKKEIPYYDGWKFCQCRDGFSADWAGWVNRGLVDFACPMSYFKSTRLVELHTMECKHLIPAAASKIWVGLCLGAPSETWQQDPTAINGAKEIEALLREQEKMGQKNCCFYGYHALRDEHIPVLAAHRKA